MRTLARRLQRLEERFGLAERLGPEVDDSKTRRLRSRLQAARLRTEKRPISPERQRELRGMSIAAILNSSRYPLPGQYPSRDWRQIRQP
jgi:hypothetical protein